jgi:hypothetical protein
MGEPFAFPQKFRAPPLLAIRKILLLLATSPAGQPLAMFVERSCDNGSRKDGGVIALNRLANLLE